MTYFTFGSIILILLTLIFYVIFFAFCYYYHERKTSLVVIPALYTFSFFVIGFLILSIASLVINMVPGIIQLYG